MEIRGKQELQAREQEEVDSLFWDSHHLLLRFLVSSPCINSRPFTPLLMYEALFGNHKMGRDVVDVDKEFV